MVATLIAVMAALVLLFVPGHVRDARVRVGDAEGPPARGAGADAGRTRQGPATSPARLVTDIVDRARDAAGAPGLRSDAALRRAAARHSRAMAARGRPYHAADNPVAGRAAGWTVIGESVGSAPRAAEVVRAWLKSAADRRNLLDPALTRLGAGVVRAGGSAWVTVLVADGHPGPSPP